LNKTKKEYKDAIAQIKLGAANIAINFGTPYRTGTLQRSFKTNNAGNKTEIGTDLYYMPYTTEEWIASRWKGRENPNEGWFEETAEFMAKMIARHIGGKYVKIK